MIHLLWLYMGMLISVVDAQIAHVLTQVQTHTTIPIVRCRPHLRSLKFVLASDLVSIMTNVKAFREFAAV
jgi:hypothetical protein